MKNETIKTYQEITPLDGLKLLVENDGKPVDGLAYTLDDKKTWEEECTLEGYDGCYFNFRSAGAEMNMLPENCAKVTEIDPCNNYGCPKLEPWMAYVGEGRELTGKPYNAPLLALLNSNSADPSWHDCFAIGSFEENPSIPYAIDVRTEWAQEHFPEHCRIRNFQEPDAFEEFCEAWALDSLQYASPKWFKVMMKQAYELGQANPTK